MKIDKKTLDMIAALPDEQLWSMVKLVSGNLSLGDKRMPTKSEIANIRLALSSIGDSDIKRATEIFELYKNGGK